MGNQDQKKRYVTRSSAGYELDPYYSDSQKDDKSRLEEKIALPGQFTFTRGIYSDMYRTHPWVIRIYTGFGLTEDANVRF